MRAALGALHRGAHHRVAAEGMHVHHRDAEPRDVRARALDRVRDVVQLAVDEHRTVQRDPSVRLGSVRPTELETDLEQSHLAGELLRQPFRGLEIRRHATHRDLRDHAARAVDVERVNAHDDVDFRRHRGPFLVGPPELATVLSM